MTDSRQLDILKRIQTQLEGITVDAGYEFDMNGRVFRGRLIFGDDEALPLITIAEHLTADIVSSSAGFNQMNRDELWVLLVQGFVKHDPDNPTDLGYQLKASVEHRLARCIKIVEKTGDPAFPDEYMLGLKNDGIVNITIGPGVVSSAIRVESGSSAKAFFYLPVGVEMALDVSDPFLPES